MGDEGLEEIGNPHWNNDKSVSGGAKGGAGGVDLAALASDLHSRLNPNQCRELAAFLLENAEADQAKSGLGRLIRVEQGLHLGGKTLALRVSLEGV